MKLEISSSNAHHLNSRSRSGVIGCKFGKVAEERQHGP